MYAKYATIPSLFLGVSVTYELLVISNEILRAVSLQAKHYVCSASDQIERHG